MRTRRWAVLLVLLSSASALAQLLSDRGPPLHRFVHRNTFAARLNPLGLIYDGRFMYRQRLFDSPKVALRDNFLGLGLAPGASPVFGRIGVVVELQPLTILGFWAMYDYTQYFGTLNLLAEYPSASANFSDSAIRSRIPPPHITGGTMLTFGANLNLKFGPIVVRSQARLFAPDFKLRPGDTVFYDQISDLLLANGRFAFTNDLDLLFQTRFGLLAGLRYNVGVPFYGPENAPTVDNSTHRLGPFLAFRFFDRDGAGLNQPTLALVINWHLKHRWRTGADSPTALPYLALAFNMVGDLMPLDP
ncbi:MAG: hypothetical protein H6Q89_4218 [Myxococcaceae bacterium]|nr:hypothetical protein [Myxococcaceae bacterium]